MFLEYTKKILKKWFGKFTLISSISGLILFYINIDTRDFIVDFISNNLLYVSLVFLFIATYQVWSDAKLEKIELEEKLRNPINYDIKALIKKIVVNFEYLENFYDEQINKSKKLIIEVDNEINKLEETISKEPLTMQLEVLRSLSLGMTGSSNKTNREYLSELKYYKDELEDYPSKKDEYLLKWKSFLDNQLKNVYYVNFQITNIGVKSDEDIDIQIFFHNDNKYIGNPRILDDFPKAYLPIKPKQEDYQFNVISDRNHFDNDLYNSLSNSNPEIYRRYEKIEEKKFSIKIKDLKVSKTVRIFEDKGYFISIEDENDIDVNIVSKHLTSPINKKVIFEKLGDYDYFKESVRSYK